MFWGNFFQSIWDKIVLLFGEDEFTFIVIYTNIWAVMFYWTLGLAFVALDVFNWPRWIQKYKVQPGTNEPVETKRVLEVISQVIFNHAVVNIPMTLACYLLKKGSDVATLPDFSKVVLDLIVFSLVEEIGFYYSHRLFHHPIFYKRFHKKHHEWTAPIAITSSYCHPLEHLLSNILPLIMGPIMMSSHVAVILLWVTLALTHSLIVHSGYHFPGFFSPESHDFHHLKFTECFGALGILDYLHGTDKIFRSSPPYKRHIVSFNLEPVRSRFT